MLKFLSGDVRTFKSSVYVHSQHTCSLREFLFCFSPRKEYVMKKEQKRHVTVGERGVFFPSWWLLHDWKRST